MTTEVHTYDWGTALRITLKDGNAVVPLADAEYIKVRFSDPDEVTFVRDMIVTTHPGTDGKVHYIFAITEIDQEGTWQYQVKVKFPAGFWQSDILSFVVYENLTVESASQSSSASVSPSASPSPSA